PPIQPQILQNFGSGVLLNHTIKNSQRNCRRKAVFVGINYFGQRGQLRGCTADVRNMTNYLVENFGYHRQDMILLTDDQQGPVSQPTKQNILRALHWLVKGARPNDSLFFYYSGHGPNTGLDGEFIYPVDFRQFGHISDEEMHRIIVQPLQSGVHLTVMFDSYHSDTACGHSSYPT
ncbi:hypothetical protein GQ53DRAFT_671441, partial [Thozetella sp. PMI_491]